MNSEALLWIGLAVTLASACALGANPWALLPFYLGLALMALGLRERP